MVGNLHDCAEVLVEAATGLASLGPKSRLPLDRSVRKKKLMV